jgi:hypothetical protein
VRKRAGSGSRRLRRGSGSVRSSSVAVVGRGSGNGLSVASSSRSGRRWSSSRRGRVWSRRRVRSSSVPVGSARAGAVALGPALGVPGHWVGPVGNSPPCTVRSLGKRSVHGSHPAKRASRSWHELRHEGCRVRSSRGGACPRTIEKNDRESFGFSAAAGGARLRAARHGRAVESRPSPHPALVREAWRARTS